VASAATQVRRSATGDFASRRLALTRQSGCASKGAKLRHATIKGQIIALKASPIATFLRGRFVVPAVEHLEKLGGRILISELVELLDGQRKRRVGLRSWCGRGCPPIFCVSPVFAWVGSGGGGDLGWGSDFCCSFLLLLLLWRRWLWLLWRFRRFLEQLLQLTSNTEPSRPRGLIIFSPWSTPASASFTGPGVTVWPVSRRRFPQVIVSCAIEAQSDGGEPRLLGKLLDELAERSCVDGGVLGGESGCPETGFLETGYRNKNQCDHPRCDRLAELRRPAPPGRLGVSALRCRLSGLWSPFFRHWQPAAGCAPAVGPGFRATG